MKNCPTCDAAIPENAPGGFCPTCALVGAQDRPLFADDVPPLEEIARAFPQLEGLELIGRGGMGFVYKARQAELDRTVALKVLAPALQEDPEFTERFAREARVLGKLSHPNIVTIYEHGESEGFCYLLMEFIDGINLRQAMTAGRFSPEQALAIVPGICDALQTAHNQGVWHRDIKPENILLDQEGRVKIADFGIARLLNDQQKNFTLTMTGNALGSAAYMSPEQFENPHSVDHRADLYSLGVVFYEMLTGELPLGRFPMPSERSSVDSRIDELVLKTLEKERDLRQQSAAQIKTDITRAARAAERDGETRPAPPTSTVAPISSRSLLLFFGGIGLGLMAALVTSGNAQGVLLSIAVMLSVVGFVQALQALGQMRRGEIGTGLRTGLRMCTWGVLALFLGALAMLVVYSSKQNEAVVGMREAQQDERIKIAEVKARAEALRGVTIPRVRRVPVPPQSRVADPPVEKAREAIIKMSQYANRSDGAQFNNLLDHKRSAGSELTSAMEGFLGTPALIVQVPNKRVGISSPYSAWLVRFEKEGEVPRYDFLTYVNKDGRWRYKGSLSVPKRAVFRVRFTPEEGDAAVILHTHLDGASLIEPVADSEGLYDLWLEYQRPNGGLSFPPRSGEPRRNDDQRAQGVIDDLQKTLSRFGYGEDFEVMSQRITKGPWVIERYDPDYK